MPLFLFMAAGAMLAGGGYLLDEAKRESARKDALRAVQHESEILDAAARRDEARAMAKAQGLDPELVARGAAELGNRRVTVDQVMAFLGKQG